MEVDYEVIIIGAGVVGLGVARSLAAKSVSSVLVIEKEDDFGRGVSSRNSEVIHSGIYYPRDSLKLKYCRLGREKLYHFCKANDVWHSQCGKLVVAQAGQEKDLEELYKQAEASEVPGISMMSELAIRALEPDVMATSALFVGSTGIVSAHELMSAFSRHSTEADHDLLLKASVVGAEPKGNRYSVAVSGPGEGTYEVTASWVVNAAGMSADHVAGFLKDDWPTLRYSKGSYFKLSSKWRNRVMHLVYPIPDEEHDSLGIHLSFDQGGNVRLGPSAEWVDDRNEDYTVPEDDRELFYTAASRYLGSLEREDLTPDFAGIRPKLAGPEGEPSDFYVKHEEDAGYRGWINLLGIDSPGLTAAIAIGEEVARWITEE